MVTTLNSPQKLVNPSPTTSRYTRISRSSMIFSEEAIPYIELVQVVGNNLRKLNVVIDDVSIGYSEEQQQTLFSRQRVSKKVLDEEWLI